MRNAKCEIMNVPTDVLPHNYALRIMNLFHTLGAKNVKFLTLFAPKV